MNDPNHEELISAFLDGELSAEEQVQVERLMAEKPELRRWCDELKAMRTRLQAMPRRRLGTDFAAAIAQRAKEIHAKQALEDHKTPASPAAAAPPAKPAPSSAPGNEPEATPARWQFVTFSARTVFWPLAALAAGLLLMCFAPNFNPPPVATNESRRQSDRESQETFSDLDGEKSVMERDLRLGLRPARPADSPGNAPSDPFDAAPGGIPASNSPAVPKLEPKGAISDLTADDSRGGSPATRPTLGAGSAPSGGSGLTNENEAKDQYERDSAERVANDLMILEVTVPEKSWQETSFKETFARRHIKLTNQEETRSSPRDDLHLERPADEFHNAAVPAIELREIPEDKLKVIAQSYTAKPSQATNGYWYLVSAPAANLKDVITDLKSNGSQISVKDLPSDFGKKTAKATELAAIYRSIDLLQRESELRTQELGDSKPPLSESSPDEEVKKSKSSSTEGLIVPPPPTITLGPPPAPVTVTIAPVNPAPGPVGPSSAPDEKPANKPASEISEKNGDKQPERTAGQPVTNSGEKKPAAMPPGEPRTKEVDDEREKVADQLTADSRFGNNKKWSGTANPIRYQEVAKEIAARYSLRAGAVYGRKAGEEGDKKSGGRSPDPAGGIASLPATPQPSTQNGRVENPVAGKNPSSHEDLSEELKLESDPRFLQDRKEGLAKLPERPVRVLIVFKRADSPMVQPASGTAGPASTGPAVGGLEPAGEQPPPDVKK